MRGVSREEGAEKRRRVKEKELVFEMIFLLLILSGLNQHQSESKQFGKIYPYMLFTKKSIVINVYCRPVQLVGCGLRQLDRVGVRRMPGTV